MARHDELEERRPGRIGRPPREAASPSALAPALLRWAMQRGGDVTTLANRGGLSRDDADRDEVSATATGIATMLALIAETFAEPHLALRLPAELPFRRYDAGALSARVAATPHAALAAMGRFAALVFPRLEASVGERDGEIWFQSHIRGAPRGLGHHVDEYVLAFALTHCRRGGVTVVPRRVWLTSPRPSGDLGPLVRATGTEEIEFGAETTGLTLSCSDGSLELPSFDPMLVVAAEQIASAVLATAPRTGALAKAVAAKIEALLPAEVTAEAIASAMKMSGRTLQRRLEEEGLRFSAVVDEVRERSAKRLLADDALPLAEIAYRLGFSDLAAFSRAFKRWTGMPPGAFRRVPR
ncbi:MAG TPA: helix-turn-helix domain-containing protein [Labilithrix sp.]|nr:helix-turn-helix domain-containing protein [Labilithrix sp.]